MKVEKKERMRDGDGVVLMTHFVNEEQEKHLRILAELELKPGCSIGKHQHVSETEYYLIVSGEGIVDDDGTETPVKPGDAVITGNGASHSIRNTGTIPLVLHAIIINY
jgi:mannose-6-phosphate isomerase-like protein (cupin superfamily)